MIREAKAPTSGLIAHTTLAELTQEIQRLMQGRVREFRLAMRGDGLVLMGRAPRITSSNWLNIWSCKKPACESGQTKSRSLEWLTPACPKRKEISNRRR